MTIALVHDHFDDAHLDDVIAEMKTLGAPTIKAVWMECYDRYQALEGCHRIRAAKALGLVPSIEEVEYSDDMVSTVIGDVDDDYPISSYCDDTYRNTAIEF
jgi:hypothetical protein